MLKPRDIDNDQPSHGSPYMDSSQLSSEGWMTWVLRVGCRRISGLSVEDVVLLANMDSRAPRANRGAGVKRQGCYRPVAVSVGPKGHRHITRSASRVDGSVVWA